MYHFIVLTASVQLSMLGHRLCQTFSWKALRGPVGTLSAVCGVHVAPVARLIATENRRNWLYYAVTVVDYVGT